MLGKWDTIHQQAFKQAKQQLASSQVLIHYDRKEPLLACDASPYRIGAVLSHRMEDDFEQPVTFASRLLSPAEKNYAQSKKEALAIIFGVTKFYH